jgi:drug/metabolite transporter (DMT)-like permease
MTNTPLLIWIIIGGALEYLGAQAATIAFNSTLSAGMNGGIVGALIACNTVFVMAAAYFLFKESFSLIKLLCVICLMSSVVLVTLFPPDNIFQDDFLIQSAGVGGVNKNMTDSSAFIPRITQDDVLFHQIAMVVGGLVASVAFGS